MGPPILCTALAWALSPYFLPANLLVVYLIGIVSWPSVPNGARPSWAQA
jgi:hypothetical protein